MPIFGNYHLPQVVTCVTAMKQHLPSTNLVTSLDAIRTCADFDVPRKALENEKGHAITPQTVKQGPCTLNGFDDDGPLHHLAYVSGEPTEVHWRHGWTT